MCMYAVYIVTKHVAQRSTRAPFKMLIKTFVVVDLEVQKHDFVDLDLTANSISIIGITMVIHDGVQDISRRCLFCRIIQ